MKRIIPLLGLALVFTGCQLDNPVTSNTDQPSGTGAGNLPVVNSVLPANGTLLQDDSPDSAGISATVVITFSDYMDPTTINDSSIKVRNTTADALVQGLVLTYSPNARRLSIRSRDWQTASEYLVTAVSGGVRNRYGAPLDGNANLTSDGTPYDDYLSTFYTTGGNVGNLVAIAPPTVLQINPDTSRVDTVLPNVQVVFSAVMDSSTLVGTSGTPKNITLTRASDGNVVPIQFTAGVGASLQFAPTNPLSFGQKYQVNLAASKIMAKYPARTPEYVRVLDSDGRGLQANEPDLVWCFVVDTVIPPRVQQSDRISNGARLDFSKLMDEPSLAPELVLVYDDDGFVPGAMYKTLVPGAYPLRTRLEYYFSRPVQGTIRVRVVHRVKDTKGLLLDSNGNGVGGEPTDDYVVWLP
jgi:hypothetical protein